jgi:FtsP/CotA-like multicopper oxidase with cupredoxin domain
MRRTLLVVLAFGCVADDAPTVARGSASAEAGASDTDAQPELRQPPDATDLDPAEDVVHVALTASNWAYDGEVPGPTLRARVGDTLVVDLTNDLPDPTTIHWHGLHAPFAIDGVTWQSEPVAPGASFTYTLPLDRAGTFWYHPHFDSDGQVDRGLYGMLVVEDPVEPVPDVDVVWVFDVPGEWSDDEDAAHGFRWQPAPWTVNGQVDPVLRVAGGDVVRARLVNVSNEGYLALSWPELRVIGGDQGLLSAEVTDGPLVLAPGDRAVVELRPGREGFDVVTEPWSLAGASEDGPDVRLLRVEPSTAADPAPWLDWAFDGAAPSPDPGHADVVWVFSGDVHGGEWRINGEAFPDVTIPEVALDSTVVVEVRNLSPTSHPFHLHGMPFEVLSVDGVPPDIRRMEDTIDVGIRQRVRLRVVADNPGDWMAHCHILPHAHHGMMTVLRVE